ncbi:hypothetical protein [uncultured Streptococcus sp.]|uniref:hypothetical protein n=1 Tax=uncultured Streptococcus sp. TaxID=83427 RepID=UPI0028DCC613|nr:hypothetical protein [uncultured Streptococcus sp.]
MNNIPTWVSAGAATLSLIFTVVSWYLSNKSKKAKEKADEAHKAALAMSAAAERSAKAAEERAYQSEKLLEQMQQLIAEQQSQSQSQSKIAASLRRPVLELADALGDYHYTLRNTTESSIKILKVLNHDRFRYYGSLPEIPAEVHPGKPVELFLHHTDDTSLDLQIEVSGKEETLYVEIPQ